MAEFDFSQAIGEARSKYESIAKALDIERLKSQIATLETEAASLVCGTILRTRRR